MPRRKITRRRDAMKKGVTRYYTGVECLRGHLSERRTSTGGCMACIKEDRNGKYKDYHQSYLKEYQKRTRAEFAAARDAKNATL